MSGRFIIISFYEHVTGTCNIIPLKDFDTKEDAIAYFELNRNEFQDNNPTFHTIVCEHEDGSLWDLGGYRMW